jgi:hypothetical protein
LGQKILLAKNTRKSYNNTIARLLHIYSLLEGVNLTQFYKFNVRCVIDLRSNLLSSIKFHDFIKILILINVFVTHTCSPIANQQNEKSISLQIPTPKNCKNQDATTQVVLFKRVFIL